MLVAAGSGGSREGSMRRSSMLVPVMVLGLATGVAAAGQQQAAPTATKAPRQMIRVEKAHLELGTFIAGSEVVGTFVFHNDGDRPVKIVRAKPT